MAAKKNTPPTTKQTGVEKIIDHLTKHKDEIGAIVVAVTRKPEAQLTAQDGDKCDSSVLSADLYGGYPESDSIGSPTARGLACLAEKIVNRGRGPFG